MIAIADRQLRAKIIAVADSLKLIRRNEVAIQ